MRISICHEKYQTDMFENMNMIWQHKGSELICKYTRFAQLLRSYPLPIESIRSKRLGFFHRVRIYIETPFALPERLPNL